ncbi:alpha/beta fold hydrolase [Massilia sp. W12]|uniref:esterase/lipase family protein n=1 Tax=Massilia sp. W12 TaxID=3126507 RepID=UPI0030D41DE5
MIARFLRRLLWLQALAILALAGWLLWLGLGWLTASLLALAGLIAVRILITLQNFVLAWHYGRGQTRPAHSKLTLWQKLRLFAGEWSATLSSSSWLMISHMFSERDKMEDQGLPVLLVHGWACNSGYWSHLSRRLMAQGIRHYALDLEPALAPIDAYTPLLAAKIDAVLAKSGAKQVIIVAHSMGGLATRAYLRAHGAAKIAHVITLGSPHHGTGLANFGMGENSRQMRYHKQSGPSPWLQTLAASETKDTRALFTSIWSRDDNIISPQNSSELPGARNIALHGMGHVALALHPQVQDVLLQEIAHIRSAAERN